MAENRSVLNSSYSDTSRDFFVQTLILALPYPNAPPPVAALNWFASVNISESWIVYV